VSKYRAALAASVSLAVLAGITSCKLQTDEAPRATMGPTTGTVSSSPVATRQAAGYGRTVRATVRKSSARCEEDSPCWQCATMGNRTCGPTPVRSTAARTEPRRGTSETPQGTRRTAVITWNPAIDPNKPITVISDHGQVFQAPLARLALVSCNQARTVCKVYDMDTGMRGTADGLSIYAD
jgi:hypothetical protein